MTKTPRPERVARATARLEADLAAALGIPAIPHQVPGPRRPPPTPPNPRCALRDTTTIRDTILDLLPEQQRTDSQWRVFADLAATIAAERIHAHNKRQARDERANALARAAVAGLNLTPPTRSSE